MKKALLKSVPLLLISVLGITLNSFSQTLKSPPEDKALVYFVRSNGTGALINFKFFDGEKYLGKFNGMKYFIYECEPGEHVFWAASENRSFVEAELQSGKTYVIDVRPTPGAMKSAVKLIPVTADNAKAMKHINKLISKKEPIDLDAKDFSNEAEDLDFFIQNGLKKYMNDRSKEKSITQLKPEHAHN
ncbi:DUF2846 domain-containing protein [Belliella kenyensis]|uniref:DUF2846 domain-containing protein n=1 Tax=Belliella kenyensis TaxID=1472724 RepID=A0ABV8EKT3_9BACT|nr:DUF2846 domain-containing protein [Belliella kenyensis]MCH7402673.1 DUF2846 domain-containing protein [Belliella kenyensis]MDN3603779.1 DUF2846 domain-containing protein [Belliella kenyensis]